MSFDTTVNGIVAFAALNANGTEPHTNPQVLISTHTGNIQLFEGVQLKWNRDEALTTGVVSGFVKLPPPKAVVGDHEGETFVERVGRHIGDLQARMSVVVQMECVLTGFFIFIQKLPAYIIHFVQRFFSGQSIVLATKVDIKAGEELNRDEFGFRQIIVVATMFGKVYGLDSATGEVVWSRLLGLGWAAEVGGRIIPVKLFEFNGEGVGMNDNRGERVKSDVVIVAQRTADNVRPNFFRSIS